METFQSLIIPILKAVVIIYISAAFKIHGWDCTERNGKQTELADQTFKSMTGKENAKHCPWMVSFRIKSSDYPVQAHLQQVLRVTMGADSHLDENDGLPSEMTVKLNSTLGYTGAREGNSTLSVKLLQIYMDLNEST